MSTIVLERMSRRLVGNNVWLRPSGSCDHTQLEVRDLKYEVLASEEAVGRAQFEEIKQAAENKEGDLVIILLGGRGAQALYRLLGELAQTDTIDHLLGRLYVFTQDALAPMRMDNGLSFVHDFERLLGNSFFKKIKSFTQYKPTQRIAKKNWSDIWKRWSRWPALIFFFWAWGPRLGRHLISHTLNRDRALPLKTWLE